MHITVITRNHGTYHGEDMSSFTTFEQLRDLIEETVCSAESLQLSVDGGEVIFPKSIIADSVFIINK